MANPPGRPSFDPFCGMSLDGGESAVAYAYFGETYAFCSEECRDLFAQAPGP